jgi:hypothetical protein
VGLILVYSYAKCNLWVVYSKYLDNDETLTSVTCWEPRLPLAEVGRCPTGDDFMNASSLSVLSGLASAGVIAGTMALSSPSQAATVDHVLHLDLDGMSTGTCAGTICPTPLGTVTVTGDTTSSLDFSVALAADVNFSAGDSFWFTLSAEGNPITFALEAPTSGTIGGEAWNWITPFSTGSFTPAPGADFPGPYADLVQCTAAGSVCGTELNFTASGADATHPFVIAQPGQVRCKRRRQQRPWSAEMGSPSTTASAVHGFD